MLFLNKEFAKGRFILAIRIAIDLRAIQPHLDGIGVYCRELAMALDEHPGIEKIFALISFPDAKAMIQARKITFINSQKSRFFPFLEKSVKRTLSLAKIDIFIWSSYTAPFFAKKHNSCLVLYDVLALTIPGFFHKLNAITAFFAKFFVSLRMTQSLSWCKHHFAISYATAQNFKSLFKLNRLPSIAYPGLGSFFLRFANEPDYDKAKNYLLLPERYILLIANMKSYKNIWIQIKAFKLIRDRIGNIDLVLRIKTDHEVEALKSFCRELSIENQVHFLNYLTEDNLIFLYMNSALVLFASKSEGFGLPILESMALGIPVVTSDRLPFREICPFKPCLANPDSEIDIMEKASSILTNPKLHNQLAFWGKRISFNFSWKHTVSKYLNSATSTNSSSQSTEIGEHATLG